MICNSTSSSTHSYYLPPEKIKITLIVCTALAFLGICIVGTLSLVSNFTGYSFGPISNVSWPLGFSLTLLGSIVSSVCFTLFLTTRGCQKSKVDEPMRQHKKKSIEDNPQQTPWAPQRTVWIANKSATQELTISKINGNIQFITQSEAFKLEIEDVAKTILFYTPDYIEADFVFLNDRKLTEWGEDFFGVFKKYQEKLGNNLMVIIDNMSYAQNGKKNSRWDRGFEDFKDNFDSLCAKQTLEKRKTDTLLFTSEKDWSQKLHKFLEK